MQKNVLELWIVYEKETIRFDHVLGACFADTGHWSFKRVLVEVIDEWFNGNRFAKG